MMKVPKKYWKKSHGCWYTSLKHPGGRREERRLDPDPDKADKLLCKIVTQMEESAPAALTSDITVSRLMKLFLANVKATRAPKTFKWYFGFLNSFRKTISAALRVRDLKLHHVQRWLDRQYPLAGKNPHSETTRHDAVVAIKRVFNWATNEMEYFDRNPVARLKRPPAVSRGTYLDPQQWQQVFAKIKDESFRDFLWFLLRTGSRPQEGKIIEARHCNFIDRVVRLLKREVKGKRQERRIRLDDEALHLAKKWALRYPKGPIFRNTEGNPWTTTAITTRFARLKRGLPFNVHCYLTRHSWFTEGLANGVPVAVMSEMGGHQDATMTLNVYGHVAKRQDVLDEAIQKVTKRFG